MDEWIDGRMGGLMEGRIDGWMGRWKEGRRDGWMDGNCEGVKKDADHKYISFLPTLKLESRANKKIRKPVTKEAPSQHRMEC